MNYGRQLYDIVKKSLDHPTGRAVAFNIEENEARTLLKRFSKKNHGGVVCFELRKSGVKELATNEKDYFDTDGNSVFSRV